MRPRVEIYYINSKGFVSCISRTGNIRETLDIIRIATAWGGKNFRVYLDEELLYRINPK